MALLTAATLRLTFPILLFFSVSSLLQAQVGIGTTTPDPFAILDLTNGATPRGLLLPRVTTAQRTTMAGTMGPAQMGLMVADTSNATGGVFVWGGIGWVSLTGGAPSEWTRTGNVLTPLNLTDSIGIGTSTPQAPLEVVGQVRATQVWASTNGSAFLVAGGYGNTFDATGELGLFKARGSTTAPAAIQTGDRLGNITFNGYDATDTHEGGRITMLATENWMPGAHGAELSFFTVPNGTTGSLERMRIAHDGHIGIGGAPDAAFVFRAYGKVRSNGIKETSDIRWKTNVQPVDGALAKVLQLQGVYYHWRQAEYPHMQFDAKRQLGLIAQDVQAVLPEVVSADADGFLSVEYSHVVALLIEAVKTQQQEIEALKQANDQLRAQQAATTNMEARLRVLEAKLLQQNSQQSER